MATLLTAQWAKAPTEETGARGESGESPGEEAGRGGETPGPPSPRRSAEGRTPEGRTPESQGGWSWQVDPLLPPALCPRLVPPRWSAATTHLRALLSHGFLWLHEPGHSLAGPFLASLLR